MFWYEEEVKSLEKLNIPAKGKKQRIACFGSSSMRLWETVQQDFPKYEVINRAFGGSTLAACCWYFDRLIPQLKPDAMIIYAGDNDLGDGRHPEEVFFFFKTMMGLIDKHFGNIPVAFISIKPSVSREYLFNSIAFTNKIISNEIRNNYKERCTWVNVFDDMHVDGKAKREFYQPDGLHITPLGYKLWKNKVQETFISPKLEKSRSTKKQRVA